MATRRVFVKKASLGAASIVFSAFMFVQQELIFATEHNSNVSIVQLVLMSVIPS